MYCLETSDIQHRFADHDVLSGVSMQVPAGSIYGFLGPNGAGKTTTLRLILGLLKLQRGEIRIFGKLFDKNRIAILRNVGSLIESPSLYDHLSAAENLRLMQIVHGCPENRIAEVLELVGLGDTGKKRAKQFSLGMRQRLAIAGALLHRPSLIILDEPTNGLDPSGIIEIRNLLIELNRRDGCTVLVSSHLLSEVERVATHVGILGKGKLLFQGTIDELRRCRQEVLSIRISTNDNDDAVRAIAEDGVEARMMDGEVVLPALTPERIAALNRKLTARNLDVYEIRTVRNDLETIFLNLVKE
ncbi:MAG: lantibiotic transport system ATP-binding protein [Thermoanaerobaculia bacterium]|jgi:ABC-2 type transport system ATP-binding protein|nr:lantibiotic transport system ATP-binding protein [Thermoanaerobaculia bacterium]